MNGSFSLVASLLLLFSLWISVYSFGLFYLFAFDTAFFRANRVLDMGQKYFEIT